ncbi:MAG: insulinase family protein [Odoribacteraceae bacterium]|jgi:predicted Zn-dependent peptidase|nr:insulinase family protein [Odoribacteraceae bacterium]
MKINRRTPPPPAPLATPSLLPCQQFALGNGLQVTCLHDPSRELVKIDVSLPCGAYHQPRPIVASTALNLLNEGTSTRPAEEIADFLDFHGAFLDLSCGMHRSEIGILSLARHATGMIDMLASMILDSTFPRREMEIYLRNKKQQHADNMEKTSYLAREAFLRLLHGERHPYANRVEAGDFDRVTSEEARAFHRSRLSAPGCRVVLSGNIDDALPRAIERHLAAMPGEPLRPDAETPTDPAPPGLYRVSKPGAVQASLRVGKSGVRLDDEDHAPFQLLNMALGGYFGSRLMSNIREDKGYTYGIQSANVNLARGAYWMILADVNARHAEATVDEIRKEIRRLQEEPMSDEELQLVKTCYHGEVLQTLDGVFAQADALKYYLEHGTDASFCLRALEQARRCTPESLMLLARKHLSLDEMYTVIVGP